MKFLTDKQYEDLIYKSTNSKEVRDLKERIENIITEKDKEIANIKKDNEKTVADMAKDHEIIIKRKDLEVDVKVSEKTKDLTETVSRLTIENGNYKKETEILTNAFKNLGFDVKDMKDILNKLVDGVVSKNSIQLIK